MNRPQHSAIETAPLAGVCAGLLLAALPLVTHIAPWALALFGGAVCMRLLVNRQQLRLPSLALKVGVLLLGFAGIALSYGSMFGMNAGLGILLILVSLKLLETNNVRDFQVLTLLGWFLSLCGLFFAQDLKTWLYIAAVCGLLTASLIRFHRGANDGAFSASARTTATLALQALPIVVLLFLFFPRTSGGFRLSFNRGSFPTSGMSERLEPGSVAALALSDEIAFRVTFPDGNVPSIPQMYWRGGVLWRGDGLSWSRGHAPGLEPEPVPGPEKPIRQRIDLQAHGSTWLFALDRPVGLVRNAAREPGGVFQSNRAIITTTSYEAASALDLRETVLLPKHRHEAERVSSRISPRVRALAESWRAAAASDRAVVDAALRYFRVEKFIYTLEPGSYGPNALDEFLFERRAGFCEHYAASFATLMRIAKIPARLVTGYLGGEFNKVGEYVVVRQSECHVWCEVWLEGIGWKRVDPTDAIAPERISSGLESFLESQAAERARGEGSSLGATGLREIARELRMVWDNLNYQWDLRVLSFDEETQFAFFASLGLHAFPAWLRAAGITSAAALVLGLIAVWLRRPSRPRRDRLAAEYARFHRKLAAAGVQRDRAEGPLAFTTRAAAEFPADAAAIRRIGQLYAALRYSRTPPPFDELAQEVRALPRLHSLERTRSRASAPPTSPGARERGASLSD